jgi:lysophospholipase L1-like esterase
VYTSIGGSRIRLRLSNEFGNGPVTFNSVHIAVSTQGSSVDAATDKTLAFSGSPSVTVPSGKAVFSDPLDFALNPLTKIAISTYFGAVPSNITGHPGSRTTSYILAGDVASNSTMSSPVTTDHWYYITGIDVVADPPAAAIVILGDSITDGRGSTTNGNDRWPDALSRRLRANTATAQVAVLNQGIGGNGVFGGLGPSAVARYSRDVLGQRGAKWVIVLEGVNDIGGASNESLAANLISAYESFINQAHLAGFKIYGVPILPIGGSSYYSELHENIRQTVNTWIRTSGKFDAVIDLDSAVRDATDPSKLAAAYDSGDHLHLSPTGYQKMADAVDLTLFNQ